MSLFSKFNLVVVIFSVGLLYANQGGLSSSSTEFVNQSRPFDRSTMELPGRGFGFSLLDPSRFSMSQSYSTSFSSSSYGSHSFGLYLNTMSYQLFQPLVLSMDFGLYTPFYSSGGFSQSAISQGQSGPAQLVLPRIGLEYRPTKNTLISIQYFNMGDAAQAYGPFMRPSYRGSSYFR